MLSVARVNLLEINGLPRSAVVDRLSRADVLYVEGGNNYRLARSIVDCGLADDLREIIDQTTYVGTSAGTMILSRDFTGRLTTAYGTDDQMYQLAGRPVSPFDLFDWWLHPHADPDSLDAGLAQRLGCPVYAVDDSTAIRVVDHSLDVIATASGNSSLTQSNDSRPTAKLATLAAVNDRELARRWSFNERADEYRLARPPYPQRVYELLVQRCGLGPGKAVLEIGPGTGLATQELLARGAQVVAVETGAGLASHLEVDLGCDQLSVLRSDFETAHLPARNFDIAVAATSFHWVDRSVALPKLAALLRPSGWMAVWWTVFGDPERPTEFRSRLTDLYGEHLPDERRDPTDVPVPLRVDWWTDELQAGGWFDVVDVELIRWEHVLTGDGARRLFGSFPNVNEMPVQDREAFLAAIGDLVDSSFGGAVIDPYVTAVYLARNKRTLS
jgi:SAM-dependent methyltransferase